MKFFTLAILALTLAACNDKRSPIVYPPQAAPVSPGIQPIAPQCAGTTAGPDGWIAACGSAVVGGVPGTAIFDVPAAPPGLGYNIRANAWGPLAGRTIVMRYTVAGDCRLSVKDADDHGRPSLTLYVQQGLTISASEDGRWWAYPDASRGTLVEPGSYEMRAVVQPDQWANVNGHSAADRVDQFNAAVNGAGYVGFTAGGGYFGHGVWCADGGTKRVVVTDYHVE
jgi:hypothetical protein